MADGGDALPGAAATVHGTCVAVDEKGILIRGASGAGKSRLALRLMLDAPRALPPARLVADDRVRLEVEHGALIASPAPLLAGIIEVRGLGLRRVPHLARVALALVVDLDAPDAARLPDAAQQSVVLHGIALPRLALSREGDAALLIAAALKTDREI